MRYTLLGDQFPRAYPAAVASVPSFGVLLARLLHRRKLDADGLSRASAVPETAIRAVLDGSTPSSVLLRQLAPALNLHAADLFVIAGLEVPDDLTPLDADAGDELEDLVRCVKGLRQDHRVRLRQFVQALPQQERTRPAPPLPGHERYQPSYGALVMRMFRNRNLGWQSSVVILFVLAGIGPLSAATLGAVGHGRKELSPELLAGFATVLAIPADDLSALTGIEMPDCSPPVGPAAVDVAKLIWDVRRLTADQVRQVCEQAKSMRYK